VLRSSWVIVLLSIACGPSLGEPDPEASAGSSSGATTSADASTSSATAAIEPATEATTAAGETTAAATTGAPVDELPPAAEGEWLCAGFEDPIFLSLEPGTTVPWEGTACVPSVTPNPPPLWMSCGELGFGHPNLVGTQTYFTFEIDYARWGGGVVSFDMGVDYMPETDTLEGVILVNGSLFMPEICMRYVEQ
jgi:hypothetical protein